MSDRLSIEPTWLSDGVLLVELGGELDYNTAPELQRRLDAEIDAGAALIVLDLCPLRFCDSSGLQSVVSIYHRLQMGGGRMTVACDHPRVCQVFRVTRLDRMLGVVGTREEALSSLIPSTA